MTYWKNIVRARLAGEQPKVVGARNFPKVRDASESAWQRALADLSAAHEALRAEVAKIEDSQLEEPAPNGTVARYVQVHGMVQHDLYHAGQIAILRKQKKSAKKGTAKPKPRKQAKAPKAGRKRGKKAR
jgi:hypothetical protein